MIPPTRGTIEIQILLRTVSTHPFFLTVSTMRRRDTREIATAGLSVYGLAQASRRFPRILLARGFHRNFCLIFVSKGCVPLTFISFSSLFSFSLYFIHTPNIVFIISRYSQTAGLSVYGLAQAPRIRCVFRHIYDFVFVIIV